MITRIFWFLVAVVCLLCSLVGLVPIVGKSTEALVTENSSRIVNVKRGGRQVYINKNGYEMPKTRTEYTFSYEFSVNGEKYTGSFSEYKQIHKKGGKVTVYYLPFYPKIHSSMNPNHLYFLSGICLICGLVMMRSAISGRRPEINIGGRNVDYSPKYSSNNAVQNVSQNQPPQPMQQFVAGQSQTIPQNQLIQNNTNPNSYSFCPKCGSPLGVGYAFCPKCGCKF